MKYLVVVERTPTGFSAYSPDLDGCVATGSSMEEVESAIRQALQFHIEALHRDGSSQPTPTSYATYIDVSPA